MAPQVRRLRGRCLQRPNEVVPYSCVFVDASVMNVYVCVAGRTLSTQWVAKPGVPAAASPRTCVPKCSASQPGLQLSAVCSAVEGHCCHMMCTQQMRSGAGHGVVCALVRVCVQLERLHYCCCTQNRGEATAQQLLRHHQPCCSAPEPRLQDPGRAPTLRPAFPAFDARGDEKPARPKTGALFGHRAWLVTRPWCTCSKITSTCS